MVLVFVLLGMIIFIMLVICILVASILRIEIKQLVLSNMPIQSSNEKKSDDSDSKKLYNTKQHYVVKISLRLWNYIPWIKISLSDEKITKIALKMKYQYLNVKKLEKDFTMDDFKVLKKLKITISELNLVAKIGVESPVVTAFSVAILSSLISILLPFVAKKVCSKNYKYNIVPIYQNKNLYKINLNCIIELKMVHIINVIYILMKKGKSDENERTASDRKSYGYSYE